MPQKVLIFGSFDILHPGHLHLIREASKLGEVHAGFALDTTIASIKGVMPYHPLQERMDAIRQYGVIPHAGDPVDRLRVLRELDPEIVMLGHDQHAFVELLEKHQQTVKPSLRIIRTSTFHKEFFSASKFRKVIQDREAGFVLVDKPIGEASLRTVTKLRTMTGIRQIGFSGTLDPLASGLLICGISKATTLLDWFHVFPKTYAAEMTFGSVSDTYDNEGAKTAISDAIPSRKDVEKVVAKFLGAQTQEPPMFSAKKIDGKKLYELARKGETVERKKHPITIYELRIDSYEYPKMNFMVTCSSGTYIRSLVHDIGQALKVGAYMSALRRTAIGDYWITDALVLDPTHPGQLSGRMVSPEDLRERVNWYMWEHKVSLDLL